jgi:hypothetical protein
MYQFENKYILMNLSSITYLFFHRAKRLSYFDLYDLYDLYGLKFFNHKDRKALRQT